MAFIANKNWPQAKFPFWALVSFLALVFLTGGSARADVQSLALLRPSAILMCGVALVTLRKHHLTQYRFLAIWTAGIVAVVSLHLLAIPLSVSEYLPGRELPRLVMETTNPQYNWATVTVVPYATRNAFFSLFIPLAILVLGCQLDPEEKYLLLPVILALGLLSGVWAIIQIMGSPDGPLYLYHISNKGSAVGLFANRNHQAVLLSILLPALATYTAISGRRSLNPKLLNSLSFGVASVLVLLIIITGSRAGVIFCMVGLLLAIFLFKKLNTSTANPRKQTPFNYNYVLGAFVMLAIAAAAVIMSRAKALERLTAPDQADELRWKIWWPIIELGKGYFPVGAGAGSIATVYQVGEHERLLRPNYVNQAHNDWIDVFLTTGVAGTLLLIALIIAVIRQSFIALPNRHGTGQKLSSLARLGVAIIVMFALASLADYPIRTPIGSCLFAIGLLWLWNVDAQKTERTGGS